MKQIDSYKQMLIKRALRLTVLGYELEYKRDKVKKMAEHGIEPTMEMFRLIDDFNITKMKFAEEEEREYLLLRRKITNEQK